MELLTPEFGLFFWTLTAFLTVFFILRKLAWKPILQALHERENGIAESIAAAEKMRQEMSQMQSESQKLLAEAGEERAQMIREAQEIKNRILTEAKDQAKEEAAKILREAQEQIEQQKMSAMTEVKNQIGHLAIEVAEKVLRQELAKGNAQDDFARTLVEDIKLN